MENTSYKILLIEDSDLDRMAFKRLVEKNGLPYDCTFVGSVLEARGILSVERFDVVIVDYLLGDGTAFDILQLVDDIPVVLMTGGDQEAAAVKAREIGADDYLVKDIEQNYLKAVPATVENAIKHKKAYQP